MIVATRPGGVFDTAAPALACLSVRGLDSAAARALLDAAHGTLPPTFRCSWRQRTARQSTRAAGGSVAPERGATRRASSGSTNRCRSVRRWFARAEPPDRAVRGGTCVRCCWPPASGGERVQPVVDALGSCRTRSGRARTGRGVRASSSIAGERFGSAIRCCARRSTTTPPVRRAARPMLRWHGSAEVSRERGTSRRRPWARTRTVAAETGARWHRRRGVAVRRRPRRQPSSARRGSVGARRDTRTAAHRGRAARAHGQSAGAVALRLLDEALAGVAQPRAAGRHPARPRADPVFFRDS